MELAQIQVPEVLEDEDLGRLAAALRPLIDEHGGGEAGVRGAAATIADDLDRLAELEQQVRHAVDEATLSAKDIVACLEGEAAAHDIGGYRDAPPGLRVWAGATVETDDLRKLMPWLDWAFAEVKGAA